MKKILLLSVFSLAILLTSCDRVAPNYVGVLMQDWGKNGKSDFTLQKGRVNTMSPGTELFQVPLFEQRAGFEEPLHLKSADNTEFTAQPTYSYTVIEEQAVNVVFQNKHLGNGDDFMKALEDNILELKIRDLIKEESRKYVTDTLMAPSGSLKFEKRVEKIVETELIKKGLKLESFSAQLSFSDKVTAKIDQRNEVNTNVTVLDQQIIEQRKRNEFAELQTQEALIRSRGLTPEILQEQAIEKWNGVLPSTYSGASMPFVKIK